MGDSDSSSSGRRSLHCPIDCLSCGLASDAFTHNLIMIHVRHRGDLRARRCGSRYSRARHALGSEWNEELEIGEVDPPPAVPSDSATVMQTPTISRGLDMCAD